MREVTALADAANQYIAKHEPWNMAKDPEQRDAVQLVCSQGINMFRCLAIFLKPVLPAMAKKAEAFLSVAPLTWADAEAPLLGHTIRKFKPMLQRIETAQIERMVDASKQPAAGSTASIHYNKHARLLPWEAKARNPLFIAMQSCYAKLLCKVAL